MSSKLFLITLILIALIVLVGLFYYLSPKNNKEVVQPSEQTSSEVKSLDELYEEQTSDFAKGYFAEQQKNYQNALEHYEKALTSLNNSPESEAHIEYRIARVTEQIDPIIAIEKLKAIAENPNYPDIQKKYAVMWIPIIITRHYDEDPKILEATLTGDKFSTFRSENLDATLAKIYQYSLEFGSTGVADFAVAAFLSDQVRDGLIKDNSEVIRTQLEAQLLMESGEKYIESLKLDERNTGLLPRVLRARAKANASLAQIGDQNAIQNFDKYFEEAITQGLSSRLDGAIRYDYFRYGYEAFGEKSFTKTEPHLDVLLTNIDQYTGIKNYLALEKNNHYGYKEDVVTYAKANSIFKNYLLTKAGWSEDDF